MNQATSTPGSSLVPETTNLFTAAHLIWIAIFAVVVVIAILWGMRLARARRAGEREVAEHNAELKDRSDTPGLPADDTEPPSPPTAASATAAAPEPAPCQPAPPAAPPVEMPAAGAGSNLAITQIKGLGPKVAQRLEELGITTVGQVAALTDDDAAALDAQLGPFSGRMARDRWQEQARFLAAGDTAGFEAVFGRL